MNLWKKITYVPTDEEAEKSAENFVKTIKKWFPFAVMVGLIILALVGLFFLTIWPILTHIN